MVIVGMGGLFGALEIADGQTTATSVSGLCEKQPDHWKCDLTVTIPPDTTTTVETTTETVITTVTEPPPQPMIEGGAIDAPATGVLFGATLHSPEYGESAAWEDKLGKRMAIEQRFSGWFNTDGSLKPLLDVDTQQCDKGRIPELTWSPSKNGPDTILADVVAGRYDAYITARAQQAKAFKCDVFIRLAHEMNGAWYPYGRQPAAYRDFYRHVVGIFNAQGTQDDVSFVFAPSMPQGNYEAYYPGDDVVDWVGGDGYNKCCSTWKPYEKQLHYDIFTPNDGSGWIDWAETKGKPIYISETGSAEATQIGLTPPDKPAWVRGFLVALKDHPMIHAWNHEEYTDVDGVSNWQVDSSPATLDAYQEILADPYIIGR